MPSFKIQPTSLNGRTIVGGSIISAYFLRSNSPLFTRKYKSVSASRTGKADIAVRSQPQPAYWRMRVVLSALNETDLAALRMMFNESEGAVYLRVTDGDSAVWRTVVMVEGIEPAVGVIGYDVVLFVPDPTWEQDAENTDSKLNQTASPIALGPAGVINNAGTRDCEPKIVVTADVAKSPNSALNDFPYSLRAFWVNRAPRDLDNEPVYLFDQNGAAARLATSTSAAGATVIQTTGQTSITADIAAGAATIALTSAAGFNVNGGRGLIQDTRGSSFWEQFSYTGKSGNTLTGVVRGLGGTADIAHTVAQVGSLIGPSGTLINGDDVRVWLDDQPNVRRDIVSWNSTASDVVVNVSAKKAVSRTLVKAMASASVPAVGAVVNFVEGNAGLDSQGFFACESEIFHYSVKSGDQGVVIDGARGLWGTTAAAHAASALCHFNPKRVVVACGWAKADAPPADIAHRACIQLPASSNQSQAWGDEIDDANTAYYDSAAPSRPKMWASGFDRDGNTVSPLMARSSVKTVVAFQDDVPGDGAAASNYVEIAIPQGIKANDVNAVKNDWTPAAEILNLELFVRDKNGTLKLLDQLQRSATALARALPAALASTAYALKLKARYNVVTGLYVSNDVGYLVCDTATNSPTADGAVAVQIVLEQQTLVQTILVRMALASGVTAVGIDGGIYKDSGGTPDTSDGAPLLAAVSVTSTTYAQYKMLTKPVLMNAGTYWLILWRTTTAVAVRVASTDSVQGTRLLKGAVRIAGAWDYTEPNTLAGYQMMTAYDSLGGAPAQAETPLIVPATGLRTAVIVLFDKTVIILEPLQTVYVHRNTAFVTNGGAGAMLHVQETIASATSGDSVALDKWMKIAAVLTVDFAAKTVSYVEEGVTYPLLRLLSAGQPRMLLKPGNNTLTVTDPSLIAPGQLDHVTTWRGNRV